MKKIVLGIVLAVLAGTVSAKPYEFMVSGEKFEEMTHDIGYKDEKGDWWVKSRDTWYANTKMGMKYPDLKCTTFEGKIYCMKIR